MIKLHKATQTDFNNNGEAILDKIVTECIVEQRINDSYFLNATFIKDDKGLCDLLEEEKILTVPTPQGEQAFRIVDIKPIGDFTLSVFARHVFFDLNRRTIQRMKVDDGNGAFTLNKLQSSMDKTTPHTFNSNISKLASLDWWDKKGVVALLGQEENSFLSKYGGELWVDNWNVAINTQIGTDRGFQAKYKKNITGFQGNISTDKMITRIIPKGFDGIRLENYATVDSPFINNYDEVYSEVIEFPNIKWKDSPNNSNNEGFDTLAEAQQELIKACGEYYTTTNCDKPSATFTINLLDLKQTLEYKNSALFESIMLGDIVHIDYTPFNIKLTKRLEYYSYDSLRQAYEVLELGESIDNYVRDVNTSITNKPSKEEVSNQLQETIDKAFEEINNAIMTGGNNSYIRFIPDFKNPKEILALDNEDPAKAVNVLRINQAGIGLSSTGVNGTYQGITTNGKLAISEVTAHQITANLIRIGILSDIQGKSWFNLDNGTFSYADGKITFDGSNLDINANTIKINSEDVTTLGTVKSEIKQEADKLSQTISATDGRVTELTQNLDGFKFSVSNSGGYNYVKNGQFKNGITNYWNHEYNFNGIDKWVRVDTPSSKWCLDGRNTLVIHGSNSTQGQYGMAQTMVLKKNTKYTVSGYSASHRANYYVYIQRNGGDWWTPCAHYDSAHGGKDDASWSKWSMTFTTDNSGNEYKLHCAIIDCGSDGYAWFTDLQIEEGGIKTKYTPHSEEIYSGITNIDEEGVKISHSQADTYSQMSAEGFKVYKNDGKELASFGEDNKAIINEIETNIINSQTVIAQLRDKGDLNIYVSSTGSGDMTGRNDSNRANSIITALSYLFSTYGLNWDIVNGMILTNTNINIYVQGSGSYTENIFIRDFLGEGLINFVISKDLELTGSWNFSNCKRIYMNGNRTSHSANDGARFKRNGSYDSLYFHSCLNVELVNFRFYSSVQSHSGLSCRYGTNAFVSTCDFYGGNHAIFLDNNAKCHTYNVRGHGFGTRAYTINQGCFMVWERSTPTGNKASYLSGYGTETIGEGVASSENNSVQTAPPSPSNQVFTQDFSPSSLRCVRPAGTQNGTFKQGYWESQWGNYTGYANFGSAIKNWLSNAQGGVTMQVYLQRMNDSHGYASGVPVILSGNNVGTLARGEGKWFNVPSSVVSSLQSGGELIANGTGQSQYIKFETNIKLRVTATKPA